MSAVICDANPLIFLAKAVEHHGPFQSRFNSTILPTGQDFSQGGNVKFVLFPPGAHHGEINVLSGEFAQQLFELEIILRRRWFLWHGDK